MCLSDGRIKLPFDITTKEIGHLRLSDRGFAAFEAVTLYKITKTEMGSPCNENGEYKNYQKNNRMDAI